MLLVVVAASPCVPPMAATGINRIATPVAYVWVRLSKEQTQMSMQTKTLNDRGEWVEAIPLPYFLSFGRCRCECGEVRRNGRSYREHFALEHVMGLV